MAQARFFENIRNPIKMFSLQNNDGMIDWLRAHGLDIEALEREHVSAELGGLSIGVGNYIRELMGVNDAYRHAVAERFAHDITLLDHVENGGMK